MWKLMLFILWLFLIFVPPYFVGLWLDKIYITFWLTPVVVILAIYWNNAVTELIRSLK